MFKKFLQGLAFGSGFSVALVIIWSIGISYIIPLFIEKNHENVPDMSGAKIGSVVPKNNASQTTRSFELNKGIKFDRKIPSNGGILSISIMENNTKNDRPDSFQAWITEKKAYIIKTDGNIPIVKEVPYKTSDPYSFASQLIQKNVGFLKHSTISVSEFQLKNIRDKENSLFPLSLNGELQITINGVVFFLPNKF